RLFTDNGEALLILGAPGSGKTTLLLELAEQLIEQAERDDEEPIPVVFNLSSWSVRKPPISEWLIRELNERYEVPENLARRWVEADDILPLLDGLDEVAAESRDHCVQAINLFRRSHGLAPIAICSRLQEYEVLQQQLRLKSAVMIKPLAAADVTI